MDEQHGVDQAGGRWTQINIGEIVLGSGTEDGGWLDTVKVFLWRRIPTPRPRTMTEADYRLGVVIEFQNEQLGFEADDAERLAAELPALLRRAATRAREG